MLPLPPAWSPTWCALRQGREGKSRDPEGVLPNSARFWPRRDFGAPLHLRLRNGMGGAGFRKELFSDPCTTPGNSRFLAGVAGAGREQG